VTLASVAVEEVLLLLKIVFLVVLYLFIWRIVRSATRDLRLPQESFVLAPEGGAIAGAATIGPTGRLIVVKSPALDAGSDVVLNSAPLTVGRGEQNDVQLGGDEFASAEHARFDPRRDGVWVTDVGSTNGTYVNGTRIQRPRKLAPGDVVRIGETDLRFEL
jgi:FHA domain-containing protein